MGTEARETAARVSGMVLPSHGDHEMNCPACQAPVGTADAQCGGCGATLSPSDPMDLLGATTGPTDEITDALEQAAAADGGGDPMASLLGQTTAAGAEEAQAILEATTDAPKVGTTLDDRYLLTKLLGEGGMGQVFLAVDTAADSEQVAIKLIKPGADQAVEELRKEFAASRKATHPNLIKLHHLETRGQPFVVMEAVLGGDLEEHWYTNNRSLPLGEVQRIARGILNGLHALHEARLVHQDVKLKNILMTTETRDPKLTDYGIARSIRDQLEAGSGTGAGTILYMAPEQLAGKICDRRADLYATGIIVHQLLTGSLPFGSLPSDPADARTVVSTWHREGDRDLPLVPESVRPVLQRCLAPNPDDRFPTGIALRDALDAAGAPAPELEVTSAAPSEAVATNETVFGSQAAEASQGSGKGWMIGLALLLVGGVAAAGVLMGGEAAEQPEPVAAQAVVEPPAGPSPAEVRAEAERDIRAFVEQWASAQRAVDFRRYSESYATDFTGIKRTKTGNTTMYNQAEWLKDRKSMFKKGLGVFAEDIRIELADNGEMAEVTFYQKWRSKTYADQGDKEFQLRKEAAGWSITREEMLNSKRWYPDKDKGAAQRPSANVARGSDLSMPLPPWPNPENVAEAKRLNKEAHARFKAKDYTEAARLWTRAIEVGPSFYRSYGNLNYAYYHAGDYKRCVAVSSWCYERVQKYPKSVAACHYNDGLCRKELGDKDGAIKNWRRSLVLRDNATVQRALDAALSGR